MNVMYDEVDLVPYTHRFGPEHRSGVVVML